MDAATALGFVSKAAFVDHYDLRNTRNEDPSNHAFELQAHLKRAHNVDWENYDESICRNIKSAKSLPERCLHGFVSSIYVVYRIYTPDGNTVLKRSPNDALSIGN